MSKHKKLQENLRQICQFSDKNIRKVLRYIEEKPDHKIVFHKIIHKTEIRVKDGDQNHAKKLTNPEAWAMKMMQTTLRSEEHTSELQSRGHLVCRLLLENKK